jgi:hypothetical protein
LSRFKSLAPSRSYDRNQSTILARCWIRDRQIREVSFVPGWINEKSQPKFQKPSDLPLVVKHIQQISRRFGTEFNEKEDRSGYLDRALALDHRLRRDAAVLKARIEKDWLE